jgi:nitroimidazol reductase NimA-like FMN-containing flavoprotein (pyridoxamine 5'-phosphate oxidase superfamily)
MPRPLSTDETLQLLSLDVVARLATIDVEGFPHVTPLWFVWQAGAFHLTSYSSRPHVRRAIANPRIGLVIDAEEPLRQDGERPNRQIRAVGTAEVGPDADGHWTRVIRRRYVPNGPIAEQMPGRPRSLITLRPARLVAVASV